MGDVQIFVEGKTDQKFLQDVIDEWYGKKLVLSELGKPGGDIISLGGKWAFDDNVKIKKLQSAFQLLLLEQKRPLVLFDADAFIENHARLLPHSKTLGFDFFSAP
jgi:hypothetical protein